MDSTPAPADAGRLRFEMRQLLGTGSFGEVYLAVMSSTGGIRQEVAVKILARDLDPRSQPLERLRDEGRVLGALNHPVILQVRDLVLLRGRVGLVTEYVPGGDLSWCLEAGGPMPARAALQVCGHVAEALDAAFHADGTDGRPLHLVHRDVKPANIRITPHGTVKLLDFGIAKAQQPERETATGAFVLMGSLPYMAPEVLHMDVEEADMARDVFALGCTLYECLTDRLFFSDLRRKELRRQTARPERYEAWLDGQRAHLPDGLHPDARDLLLAMLAFDHTTRPSAREVADRCFDLADGHPGASLRTWARGLAFPDPADTPGIGAWTGQRVVETTLVAGDSGAVPRFEVSTDDALQVPEPRRLAARSPTSETAVLDDGDDGVDPLDVPMPRALRGGAPRTAPVQTPDRAPDAGGTGGPAVTSGPAEPDGPAEPEEVAKPAAAPPPVDAPATAGATPVVAPAGAEARPPRPPTAIVHGGVVAPRPSPAEGPEASPAPRRRAVPLLAGLAALLTVLVGVGWWAVRGEGPAPVAGPAEAAADRSPGAVEAAAPAQPAPEEAPPAPVGSVDPPDPTVPAASPRSADPSSRSDDGVDAGADGEASSAAPRAVSRPSARVARRPGGRTPAPSTPPSASDAAAGPDDPVEAAPAEAAAGSPDAVVPDPVVPDAAAPELTAPEPVAPDPVAPEPEAAQEPPPAPARVAIDAGQVAVELRRGTERRGGGEVPAGTWRVWADFGDGPQEVGTLQAQGGGRHRIRCNRLMYTCTIE